MSGLTYAKPKRHPTRTREADGQHGGGRYGLEYLPRPADDALPSNRPSDTLAATVVATDETEVYGFSPEGEAAMSFVAYYRVSTDRQGKSGLGLEAQRRAVEAHIGHAPDHEFVEVESGKRSDRPELTKALDLAELTHSTFIVAKLDRLSRNAAFLFQLRDRKAPIVFADFPEANSMMLDMMAMLAQWEGEQISKRTKDALTVAKANGRVLGGDRGNLDAVRASGVQASSQSRSKAARERNAKVMPHIAAAKADGHTSTRTIAAYLNSKGIRTARGSEWRGGSVQRLLAGHHLSRS